MGNHQTSKYFGSKNCFPFDAENLLISTTYHIIFEIRQKWGRYEVDKSRVGVLQNLGPLNCRNSRKKYRRRIGNWKICQTFATASTRSCRWEDFEIGIRYSTKETIILLINVKKTALYTSVNDDMP